MQATQQNEVMTSYSPATYNFESNSFARHFLHFIVKFFIFSIEMFLLQISSVIKVIN